jgi:hypothetical protein
LALLHFYAIQGTAVNWFRSYLTNIKQKLEIKPSSATPNFSSNWGTVANGVPQGSILGPLLFITYINDLSSTIKTLSEPVIFTDNTGVIISNKNVDDFCTLANSVLSRMSKWFSANKLALSSDTTKIIKFVQVPQ